MKVPGTWTKVALVLICLLTASRLWAQGPPYQTDDPVPVDPVSYTHLGLRKKRTETASHVDERRELFVLLVSERRQVDRCLLYTSRCV